MESKLFHQNRKKGRPLTDEGLLISAGEARKILGKEGDDISNDDLRCIIASAEKLAIALLNKA